MIRRPNYFQVGVLLMLTTIVTTLVPRPMAAQLAPQKKSSQAQPSSPDIVPAEFIGDWVPLEGHVQIAPPISRRWEAVDADQWPGPGDVR
jgi:hypothetical protein